MMGKTHITVGIAASLAVCYPVTPEKLYAAIIGGTVGGILCDIECKSYPGMRDALIARIIAAGIVIVTLLIDWLTNAGICISIAVQDKSTLILGTAIMAITCLIGRFSKHRTFTHSLLFVLLIDFAAFCINPVFMVPVFIAGVSHLAIDTFNKKPVPWLFPFFRPGFCLKICYASKIGNAICMWAGLIADLCLLGWSIFRIL